ncbi:MAG: GNAT family N-acetyltransferase, partial [Asticcacaulis sp.]
MPLDVAIAFRPLTLPDEALLRQWLNAPHVTKWWGDPEKEVGEALSTVGSNDADGFIIQGNGHDIGYIQSYDPFAWDGGFYFSDRPKGARGIDLYLGYADLTGKGLGTQIVRTFSDSLLAKGAPEVVTDPDPANTGAFMAYKKAGFGPYRVHRSPRYGHCILMSRKPDGQ